MAAASASSSDTPATPLAVLDGEAAKYAEGEATRKAVFHAVDEAPVHKPGK